MAERVRTEASRQNAIIPPIIRTVISQHLGCVLGLIIIEGCNCTGWLATSLLLHDNLEPDD